jgi:hypothetical protein
LERHCLNLDGFRQRLLNDQGAKCLNALRGEAALANKREFVDLISDATRQNWRRNQRVLSEARSDAGAEKVRRRKLLSNWPPARFAQWRIENLTPWKLSLKSWTFKDWD